MARLTQEHIEGATSERQRIVALIDTEIKSRMDKAYDLGLPSGVSTLRKLRRGIAVPGEAYGVIPKDRELSDG